MEHDEILSWVLEEDEERLEKLWQWSDTVRRENVGDEVHLRGLIEISNHCVRQCGYCGLRSDHSGLVRYRMKEEEIVDCVTEAQRYGYGTVVLQSGEDYGIKRGWLSHMIHRIKTETPLAVTLSMGERRDKDLEAWRRAGADRYLLRFETSDPNLYRLIHPSLYTGQSNRLALLRKLKRLGYEIGSGVMIGIPGQTYESLAADIDLFRRLNLDMVGVGPYLPHPSTPLGKGEWKRAIPEKDQVPNTEQMTYKVIALTRIVCPEANTPSTTALATVNRDRGRELGLMRGANVIMPNLTPPKYRALYEIYPSKACIKETPLDCNVCLYRRIESIGRVVGRSPGSRYRRQSSSNFNPIPHLASPLKGEEGKDFPPHRGEGTISLPFRGRGRVGVGLVADSKIRNLPGRSPALRDEGRSAFRNPQLVKGGKLNGSEESDRNLRGQTDFRTPGCDQAQGGHQEPGGIQEIV